MTSPTSTTPPTTGARLQTPAERPTWVELVNQERKLLDGLVHLMRNRGCPLVKAEEIVPRALGEALQEIIAKEPDEERADELRRRAAARELARMFRKGPRLVYSRPLPVQKSRATPVTVRDSKPKREIESFKAMLDERRRRRPHLIINNTRQPDAA